MPSNSAPKIETPTTPNRNRNPCPQERSVLFRIRAKQPNGKVGNPLKQGKTQHGLTKEEDEGKEEEEERGKKNRKTAKRHFPIQ